MPETESDGSFIVVSEAEVPTLPLEPPTISGEIEPSTASDSLAVVVVGQFVAGPSFADRLTRAYVAGIHAGDYLSGLAEAAVAPPSIEGPGHRNRLWVVLRSEDSLGVQGLARTLTHAKELCYIDNHLAPGACVQPFASLGECRAYWKGAFGERSVLPVQIVPVSDNSAESTQPQ